MSMKKDLKLDFKKEFIKLFDNMCYHNGLNRKSAWSDLVFIFACSISNPFEVRKDVKEKREKEFEQACERLGGKNNPTTLLSYLFMAYVENPYQDFLGDLYMSLSMGEKSWGQCFTPYHVCALMAELTVENPEKAIEENGFVSISDPCVGGGAMLIAAAEILNKKGFDVSTQMIAVGQDIDQAAVNMAYIQLAVIGCPAVLVCGNSLLEPYTGNPLFVDDNDNFWYTPSLYTDVWDKRRKDIIENYRKENISKTA